MDIGIHVFVYLQSLLTRKLRILIDVDAGKYRTRRDTTTHCIQHLFRDVEYNVR